MKSKDQFSTSITEVKSPRAVGIGTTTTKKQYQPFIRSDDGIESSAELQSKRRCAVPWLGLTAIVISSLTSVGSFLILHFIDGKVVFTNNLLKPASWLSAILSLNSIMLHIALSEGHNIAWWYKANRSDATMKDLHSMWTYGTSTWSALKSGGSFNYVAMATLFVATIPLNGFILQNAISVEAVLKQDTVMISLPLQRNLPLGWSADVNSDGTLALPSLDASLYAGSYLNGNNIISLGTVPVQGCAGGAQCIGDAPIFGFWTTCEPRTTIPYDLPVDGKSNITMDATIFSSTLMWNQSTPNEMQFRVQWKPPTIDLLGPCQGTYQIQECRLQAATVNQSVLVNSVVPYAKDRAPGLPRYSLSLNAFDFKEDSLVEILTVLPDEGQTKSTYGGIAALMSNYLTGEVNISYVGGKASYKSSGLYSSLAGVGLMTADLAPADVKSLSKCNVTVGRSSTDDFGSTMLNTLRGTLWYMIAQDSVNSPTSTASFSNPSNASATQSTSEIQYVIIWIYWIGSLIVTSCITIAVTPTYWGFWRLGRKTTMSPFETVRAFHAVFIGRPDIAIETSTLLKEIGSTNVHESITRDSITR